MSSTGTSSLGTRSSRSSEDDMNLQAQMEKRRKRRKESNRESARRSRLRKQQHLDDINTQVNQLQDQNKQLGAALRVTSQSLAAVQAQNSVLQTQKMELESRLGSLAEILLYLNAGATTSTGPAVANTAIMNTGIATTSTGPAVANAAIMNTGIATTSGACDVLGASTWGQQPVDLYYPCF